MGLPGWNVRCEGGPCWLGHIPSPLFFGKRVLGCLRGALLQRFLSRKERGDLLTQASAGLGQSAHLSLTPKSFQRANATSQRPRRAPCACTAGSAWGIRCAPGEASGSFLQPSALLASTLGSGPGLRVQPPGLPQSREEPRADSSGLLGSSRDGALAGAWGPRAYPLVPNAYREGCHQ